MIAGMHVRVDRLLLKLVPRKPDQVFDILSNGLDDTFGVDF